jgi:hypothetical protein
LGVVAPVTVIRRGEAVSLGVIASVNVIA